MMAVALTSPVVVPTAIKFPSAASRFAGATSKTVSVAASRFGSKCSSRWSSLRGTRMAHVSWKVSPRKQSSRKGLVFAGAASDCSVGGDSSLYPDASRVSFDFHINDDYTLF